MEVFEGYNRDILEKLYVLSKSHTIDYVREFTRIDFSYDSLRVISSTIVDFTLLGVTVFYTDSKITFKFKYIICGVYMESFTTDMLHSLDEQVQAIAEYLDTCVKVTTICFGGNQDKMDMFVRDYINMQQSLEHKSYYTTVYTVNPFTVGECLVATVDLHGVRAGIEHRNFFKMLHGNGLLDIFTYSITNFDAVYELLQ